MSGEWGRLNGVDRRSVYFVSSRWLTTRNKQEDRAVYVHLYRVYAACFVFSVVPCLCSCMLEKVNVLCELSEALISV